jgi:hypothetical protein
MNPSDLVLALFNARTAAHIAHLQTKSYAAHMALAEFYTGIVDIADRFAETWQGCYGPIKFGGSTLKLERDPVAMLKTLLKFLKGCRKDCDESHLQQIVDDAIELVDSTIYKLTMLS